MGVLIVPGTAYELSDGAFHITITDHYLDPDEQPTIIYVAPEAPHVGSFSGAGNTDSKPVSTVAIQTSQPADVPWSLGQVSHYTTIPVTGRTFKWEAG